MSYSLIFFKNGKGNKTYTLVNRIIIHKLANDCSLISKNKYHKLRKKYINIPPHYLANNYPKLMVAINNAYIVPSILEGHILHANTKIGSIFNSAINYIKRVSHKENTSSGIPN